MKEFNKLLSEFAGYIAEANVCIRYSADGSLQTYYDYSDYSDD